MGLIDADIKQMVFDAMPTDMRETFTLTQSSGATFDPANLETTGSSDSTETVYGVIGGTRVGMNDSRIDSEIDAGNRGGATFTVFQYGVSLSPKAGDTITARGYDYIITHVEQDPARATWELTARLK